MNTDHLHMILKIMIAIAGNNPEQAAVHLKTARENDISHRELYEGILQLHLFAGYPATIEGLQILREIYGPMQIHAEQYDFHVFEMRGRTLCHEIYTTVFDKMMKKMHEYSPDVAQWMIHDGYGKTLSREGLDIQTRELINLCVLAMGAWRNQFISHLRGSINIGIELSTISQALDILEQEGYVQAHTCAQLFYKEFITA